MQLVEQHRINRSDARWDIIDQAAFASKNLYNAALYQSRQHFIATDRVLPYEEMARTMKHSDEFRALPAKVAQWVLKQVAFAWQSFLAVRAAWQTQPSKFRGRPGLPKYLDKQGRNLLVYTTQALSRPAYRQGVLRPSGLPIEVHSQHGQTLQQVRVVPKKTHYVVEVIYEQAPIPQALNPAWIAGIDIGLDTLAALASNKAGFVPAIVNGKPLKAINQWYNKRRAALQAKIAPQSTSRALEELADKRYRRIQHYLHSASRRLIDYLVAEGIGTLVIGKSKDWKQDITLGARTNQNFVTIPHARFVEMLCYKAELVGIQVILTEESYTSKCSFLDMESLAPQEHYLGRRVHRGLFRAASGQTLHADINAALNIIRKVIPDAFGMLLVNSSGRVTASAESGKIENRILSSEEKQHARRDLAHETGVPVPQAVARDDEPLEGAFEGSMQFDLHVAYFGEAHASVIQELPAKASLREGKGIIPLPTLKARIPRRFTRLHASKESFSTGHEKRDKERSAMR